MQSVPRQLIVGICFVCHDKLKPSATRNQTGWWQKTTITGFYILSKLHVASLHTILFPILYFIHYTIQVTSPRKPFRVDFYIIFCFKKIYVFLRLIINTISLLLYFNFYSLIHKRLQTLFRFTRHIVLRVRINGPWIAIGNLFWLFHGTLFTDSHKIRESID